MKKRLFAFAMSVCLILTILPATALAAEDIHDETPPEVGGVYMNEPGATVTVGDTLYFRVDAEDEHGIRISSSSLQFITTCEQGHVHGATAEGFYTYNQEIHSYYDEEAKQAVFVLTITDYMVNGTYTLTQVRIRDNYGNESLYYPPDPDYPNNPGNPGNIDFDSVSFTVTGSTYEDIHDETPPEVGGVYMDESGATVTVGDTLYFRVDAEDEHGIRISSSSLQFITTCEQGHVHGATAEGFYTYNQEIHSYYDEEAKQAVFVLTITDYMVNGTYTLTQVRIRDNYGNESLYYPPDPDYPNNPGNPGNIDFDSIYFTVATPDVMPEEVSIPDEFSMPVRTIRTVTPTVTPADSIPKWTWSSDNTDVVTAAPTANGISLVLTALGAGIATITGTTQNGLTATCQVTVTDAPLPETGEIEENYHVNVGGFVDIVPALTPDDATAFFEVTSDNPHVASAKLKDNGTGIRVEGVNAGHATVTVRTSNGIVMTTAVTVGKETDRQHEKTTVPGYEPTCVRPGRTDEVRCSACWYVFTPSEEIPATGQHTFGEWQVQREPTATEEGLKVRYCGVCYLSETESIPATGSTGGDNTGGSTGGSTGGGGGGSVGGGGSIGGVTAPSAGQNTTVQSGGQDFSATVKDGTVSVTANDSEVDSLIDSASGGVVELDASAVDAAGVSLPQNIISAVSESEDVSGVTLKTAQGSVALSGDVVDTLADAMTGENDILTLTVDTIDPDVIPDTQKYPIASALKSAVFVELSAAIEHRNASGSVTSTEKLHELGGSVTVSVPFELPDSMEGRQIVACYIADDGSITYFPVKYENGVATFTTTHFSTYAIVESRAAAFKDVDVGAWYMLSLEYALEHDLMRGVSTQEFAPGDSATRGMTATALYRLEGEPAVTGESGFEDAAPGLWYTDAITWAAGRKILQGQGNGLCGPMDPVTREQMAVLLWRYADEPESTTDLSQFPDAGKVSSWADTAVRWAVETGILKGKEDGSLAPGGTASRAEIATILMRFRESVLEKD